MKKLRRSTWILTSAAVLLSGAAIVTLRAAEQTPKPAAPKLATPAPGAPPPPEESATIRDDPTIAPDPKQSADNDVSFPTDI